MSGGGTRKNKRIRNKVCWVTSHDVIWLAVCDSLPCLTVFPLPLETAKIVLSTAVIRAHTVAPCSISGDLNEDLKLCDSATVKLLQKIYQIVRYDTVCIELRCVSALFFHEMNFAGLQWPEPVVWCGLRQQPGRELASRPACWADASWNRRTEREVSSPLCGLLSPDWLIDTSGPKYIGLSCPTGTWVNEG